MRSQDSKDLLPAFGLPSQASAHTLGSEGCPRHLWFDTKPQVWYTKMITSRQTTRLTSQLSSALAGTTMAPSALGSRFGVRSEEDRGALPCSHRPLLPVPWLSTHPRCPEDLVLRVCTGTKAGVMQCSSSHQPQVQFNYPHVQMTHSEGLTRGNYPGGVTEPR